MNLTDITQEPYTTYYTQASVEENKTSYIAIIFATFSVLIILSNSIFLVFYLTSGHKTAHGFFVMSLCLGNCLIGCSAFLSTLQYLISGTPYVCSISTWTLTWGIIFNICVTFWICLERYIIVHHVPMKNVQWMQKNRKQIVSGTALGIAIYLTILFACTGDNNVVICDGIHLFRHLYPVYAGMTSVPVFCFLLTTVVLYRKTLVRLSKLTKKENSTLEKKKKTNLQVRRTTPEKISPLNEQSDTSKFQQTRTINLSTIELDDITNDIYSTMNKNVSTTNSNTTGQFKSAEEKRTEKSQESINWQTKAQKNVRVIICQVSLYSLSLIAGQIAANFGGVQIRSFFIAIMLLCVFISPFVYVVRVQEVKVAIQKAFRCTDNTVDISTEF
ncbi:unnamed protein product [Mytilus coruscus]|uniref:G-protein coupled receptors family 1 profile domain-containing protein n=1 Tax=Mytilus coruscus TaxID=42192 RepID=A0A6J8EB44_MYTCO|nr:unnamed protein product [Mytilus coruscus]